MWFTIFLYFVFFFCFFFFNNFVVERTFYHFYLKSQVTYWEQG